MRVETIGDATLYLGDCMEILPTLEPVDHVISDPPYSEHVHGKSRAGGRAGDLSRDGYMASYSRTADLGFPAITQEERQRCAEQFARLSRRWVSVFSDVESCHLWREALTEHGLDFCRTGVWHKLNATPQFTGDRPGVAVEAITFFHAKGRKRWNRGGGHAYWAHPIELNRSHGAARLHTTQKPLALMAALVADFTDAGDTVLDPFMGSCTTGVAAIQQGRKFIGIERDPHYFQVCCDRMAEAWKQRPLFTAPQPRPEQGDLLAA